MHSTAVSHLLFHALCKFPVQLFVEICKPGIWIRVWDLSRFYYEKNMYFAYDFSAFYLFILFLLEMYIFIIEIIQINALTCLVDPSESTGQLDPVIGLVWLNQFVGKLWLHLFTLKFCPEFDIYLSFSPHKFRFRMIICSPFFSLA